MCVLRSLSERVRGRGAWKVLLVLLSLTRCAFAQPANSHPAEGPQEAANLSRSLTFKLQRDLQGVVREVHEATQRGDWTAVSEGLQRLFRGAPGELVEFGGIIRSAPAEGARLLTQLPPPGRETYLRLVEKSAEEELQQAVAHSDLQEILNTGRRYRLTSAGRRALTHYMEVQRDQGGDEQLWSKEGAGQQDPSEFAAASDTGGQLPSRFPLWLNERTGNAMTDETVRSTFHELREKGQTPFLALSGVMADGVFMASNGVERIAWDADSGKELWSRPIAGSAPAQLRDPGSGPGNGVIRRRFALSAMSHLFGNSTDLSATTVGRNLLFVESTVPDGGPARRGIISSLYSFPAGRIVCVNARSGAVQWTNAGNENKPTFFAGPPVQSGQRLYVLAEIAGSSLTSLLILDAESGRTADAIPLGETLFPLDLDLRRAGRACRAVVDGRQIVCPTAAGALVAVDPVFRELAWAYRYPRRDATPLGLGTSQPEPDEEGLPWIGAWQQIQIFLISEWLVFVSPESDELHVLKRETGEPVWSLPRGSAVEIVPVEAENRVVLFGRDEARSLDLRTGTIAQLGFIPQPAGRGVAVSGSFLFPVGESGYARLNLSTGAVEKSFGVSPLTPSQSGNLTSNARPRNLVCPRGALFEVGQDAVRRLQPISRTRLPETASAVEHALALIERGESHQAAARLRSEIAQPEKNDTEVARQFLLHLLLDQFRAAVHSQQEPRAWLPSSAEVDDLARSAAERGIWRQLRAEECLARDDWRDFVNLWLSAPTEELSVLVTIPQDDSRRRLDRWFLAEATAVWDRSPDSERAEFSRIVEAAVSKFSATFADQQQLLRCLGQTAWGQRLRLSIEDFPSELNSRIEWQLRLVEQTDSENPELAAGAAYRLVQLDQPRSWNHNANHWLQVLERFPIETQLPDQQTVGGFLQEQRLRRDGRLVPGEDELTWPDRPPTVVEKSRDATDVYFSPVPVEAPPDSFFRRMAVELEWPNFTTVRFNGSRWNQPWTLDVPTGDRSLRTEVELNKAWGLEQLLVVQTGSELYGLTPFDADGARGGDVVWPPNGREIDLLGDSRSVTLAILDEQPCERPGFPDSGAERVNEFGHRIGAVGPVQAGSVCFQQLGMLVAIDSATGEELWRRFDLPPRAHCFGDSRVIAVLASDSGQVLLLSAVDGRKLREFHWPHNPDAILLADKTSLLLARGDRTLTTFESPSEAQVQSSGAPIQPVELERYDLVRGETVWKREWPAESLPFKIHDRWLGMLLPGGRVEFLDVATGNTAVSHQLSVPERVARIACSVAEDDFIVVFSDRVEDEDLTSAPQVLRGYRRPFVNGPAVAFDVRSGALLWRTELGDTVFPLSQPPDLPVFVTAEGRFPSVKKGDAEEWTSPRARLHGARFRCFDRRTGRLLHEFASPNVLELHSTLIGSRERQRIELRTRKTRVEFDFSSPVGEPRAAFDAGNADAGESFQTEGSTVPDSPNSADKALRK